MGYIEKVLIIAPTSVVAVWPKEFKEFAENYPDLQTYNQDEYRAIKINLSESHE